MFEPDTPPKKKEISFAPTEVLSDVPEYDHGYSEEKVLYIKEEKKKLTKKVADGETVSLEEFKTIIVPWNRIHRTEQFILFAKKPTPAKKKAAPKVKKPTKADIKKKTERIILRIAMGQALSDDEKIFYDAQCKAVEL